MVLSCLAPPKALHPDKVSRGVAAELMGGVVSSGKHKRLVGEQEALLEQHKQSISDAKHAISVREQESAASNATLESQLQKLEDEKAQLDAQQATLQVEYVEMEKQRQEREAKVCDSTLVYSWPAQDLDSASCFVQVVQRVILRVVNRCIGICFSEWKDFVLEIVKRRDRDKHSAKVAELEKINAELRQTMQSVQAELDQTEEENAHQKAKQLIMKMMHREMSSCFSRWKRFLRAHVEERHERRVADLKHRLADMEAERDALRKKLDGQELEGFKVAMQKFELETQEQRKESQIVSLTQALVDARGTLEQQAHLWPASSKQVQKQMRALDVAHNQVVLARSQSQSLLQSTQQ